MMGSDTRAMGRVLDVVWGYPAYLALSNIGVVAEANFELNVEW